MSEKEERIRSITRIYYSNPKIQKALFEFSKDREVVPRYFEGFGKRPDTFQYPSDIQAAVKKGATSFHASEEIWKDPLQLNSDLSQSELSGLRKSWDLLIDVDSPFLDYSKIATKLLLKALEKHQIRGYSIKFSGSKGFHILVPGKSFPEEYNSQKKSDMFPEWPRAICEYLMDYIKPEYNQAIKSLGINFEAIKERTNLSKEDILEVLCPNCGSKAEKTNLVALKCDRCGNVQQKPGFKITKRKLRCIEPSCPGEYEVESEKEIFKCKSCGHSTIDKLGSSRNIMTLTTEARKSNQSSDFKEEISGESLGSLDLVLVAPRHLFRMPYSLHEKTALASIVIKKEDLDSFQPKDASPLKAEPISFYPSSEPGEGAFLLETALSWKARNESVMEKEAYKKYEGISNLDISNVPESAFPDSIKKLMKGLKDGRKRGLFILITFLRSLNFPADYINKSVRDWNKKNDPPLKEGYVKSQIDWHIKQKRTILPPNYSNHAFYKDLNLFSAAPSEKNPVSEVIKKMRRRR